MDIVNPFSLNQGHNKFLVVVVDYFTKLIEMKPLAKIIAWQVQNFIWKKIICHFEIPQTIIITDIRLKFTDKKLLKFYIDLGIKHETNSIVPINQ